MDCNQAQPMLALLALDSVEPAERAELSAHVESCPRCAADLADLRRTAELLRQGLQRAPDAGLSQERRAAMDQAARAEEHAEASMPRVLRLLRRIAGRPASPWIQIAAGLAIVVVLAGLSLPSLSRAREEARRAACTSSLRAVGRDLAPALTAPAPEGRLAGGSGEGGGGILADIAQITPDAAGAAGRDVRDGELSQSWALRIGRESEKGGAKDWAAGALGLRRKEVVGAGERSAREKEEAARGPGETLAAKKQKAPADRAEGGVAAGLQLEGRIDWRASNYASRDAKDSVFAAPSAEDRKTIQNARAADKRGEWRVALGDDEAKPASGPAPARTAAPESRLRPEGRESLESSLPARELWASKDELLRGQEKSDRRARGGEDGKHLSDVSGREVSSVAGALRYSGEKPSGEARALAETNGAVTTAAPAETPAPAKPQPPAVVTDAYRPRDTAGKEINGRKFRLAEDAQRQRERAEVAQTKTDRIDALSRRADSPAAKAPVPKDADELGLGEKRSDLSSTPKHKSEAPAFVRLDAYEGKLLDKTHEVAAKTALEAREEEARRKTAEEAAPAAAAAPRPAAEPPPPPTPPLRPAAETETRAVFEAGPVNPWVMADKDRLSTFAIDVDTASYSVARSYILRGYLPPPASARMEEFVNAFDYNYPRQAENVFSVYAEAGDSPFGRGLTLLKIGVRARVLGREARKPAHLVFVVDSSGSMALPDRMPLVQYALKALVAQLGERDRVSLVTYGTNARLVLQTVPAADSSRIIQTIDAIQCGGSTNLLAGLRLGYETALRAFQPGGINRVVLCSDGVANVGAYDAGEILANIDTLRRQGISLTAAGFGAGAYNDALMEQLADKGDGNYVFIDSAAQAERVFVEELAATIQTVAQDAKIQVEFNPGRVRRFRQIGFESRKLRHQDFRDDSVDAGEVGSGQSSTALYELELLDLPPVGGAPDLGTVYVRYRNVETGEVEEISFRLADSVRRPRTPQTDPRFFLAACAAEFAEILRRSEHARDGNLDEVRRVLEHVAVALPFDSRVQEFLDLVKRAKGLPPAP